MEMPVTRVISEGIGSKAYCALLSAAPEGGYTVNFPVASPMGKRWNMSWKWPRRPSLCTWRR